jgi:protein SCO1/2
MSLQLRFDHQSRAGALARAVVAIVVLAGAIAGFERMHYLDGGAPPSIMAPDFTLLDQEARPFTLSAQHGYPVVLFFGYTHCPDECPLTLAHLAKAHESTGVPHDWRIAFITVDPARDSPATLKRYLALFGGGMIGLTGDMRRLGPLYDAYAMPRRIEVNTINRRDYFVSHGTTIYFIGRDGSVKGYDRWDAGVGDLVHDLQAFQ